MESATCIVCGKNATVGDPTRFCSIKCLNIDKARNTEATTSTPIEQPKVSEPKITLTKSDEVKAKVITTNKLCLQCGKTATIFTSKGSYCENCNPGKVQKKIKPICNSCGKETDSVTTVAGKTYCAKCSGKALREKSTQINFEGVLNNPAKINFVHISPNCRQEINRIVNDKKEADEEDEEEYEVNYFFDCFQIEKHSSNEKENDPSILTSNQWRITHPISIPPEIPPFYSSIAKFPTREDIYLVSGGFSTPGFVAPSNFFYSIIFDRRVETSKEESKTDEKESVNIRNFKYATLPKLTRPRFAHTSIVVDNYLYIIGGRTSEGADSSKFVYDKVCEKFKVDTIRDNMIRAILKTKYTVFVNYSWEPFGELREPRSNASSFAYSKRIYVFGGYTGPKKLAKTVEVYDTVEGKWTVIDNLGHQFLAGSLTLLDEDDVYIIGGSGIEGPSDAIVKWNLKTNKIAQINSMCTSRSEAHGCITTNDSGEKYLYIFGGVVGSMNYERISLKELNSENGKFQHIEIQDVNFERMIKKTIDGEEYLFEKNDIVKEDGKEIIRRVDESGRPFSARTSKFNPEEVGLFSEGYIGENCLILSD